MCTKRFKFGLESWLVAIALDTALLKYFSLWFSWKSKKDKESVRSFQSFWIPTFRYDISSPTPITEAIQLWLKLKSSKFWELCPSEEQEFLNWTLIKWRKASSGKEISINIPKMKFWYSPQLAMFWQCPYIYELIVMLRTICLCSRYHAWSGPSIFLPRVQSHSLQKLLRKKVANVVERIGDRESLTVFLSEAVVDYVNLLFSGQSGYFIDR